MRNLERRLRKLEMRSTDGSGFVPHSPEWLSYWVHQADLYLTSDLDSVLSPGVLLPQEALEAWIRQPDDGIADGA
jgi:hypothetical protein